MARPQSVTKDQLLELAKKGMSNIEVSRHLKISRFSVSYYCQKFGLILMRKPKSGTNMNKSAPLTASGPAIERYIKKHQL